MTSAQKTSIVMRFTIPGFHYWQQAKGNYAYLAKPHRHLFSFELKKTVTHSDRDIEFIEYAARVKQYIIAHYETGFLPGTVYFNGLSCEAIAQELVEKFELQSASVFEDNENGAIVEALDV